MKYGDRYNGEVEFLWDGYEYIVFPQELPVLQEIEPFSVS